MSFQASILFDRATADFAQRHRISNVDELPSRSTDSISRSTNRIEYPISNCPAKSRVGGFLQTSLSKVIRRSRLRRSPALWRRITPDRVIALSVHVDGESRYLGPLTARGGPSRPESTSVIGTVCAGVGLQRTASVNLTGTDTKESPGPESARVSRRK